MPNKNYRSGRAFEYEIKKAWEEAGYIVLRTAGSHGIFDLVAFHKISGTAIGIQCKKVKTLSDAHRLIKAFKDNPPFPAASSSTSVIAVKVPREGVLYGWN